MGASVTLADESFTDDRIGDLAELLNVSRYEALGRLAFVWKQATVMGVSALTPSLIAKHIDPQKLIDSDMGWAIEGGRIELRGGAERLLWLKNKRDSGREHGPKGAEFGKLGGRPPKTPTKPGKGVSVERGVGVRNNPPSASAPAPAQEDISLVPAEPEPTDSFAEQPLEALELAGVLAQRIEARQRTRRELKPDKRERTLLAWADSFRLAHERDGRDWAQMRRLLEWCQADAFWRDNVLSGAKFRARYDDLDLRMNAPAKTNGKPGAEPPTYRREDPYAAD
jgi:hypothetical protein